METPIPEDLGPVEIAWMTSLPFEIRLSGYSYAEHSWEPIAWILGHRQGLQGEMGIILTRRFESDLTSGVGGRLSSCYESRPFPKAIFSRVAPGLRSPMRCQIPTWTIGSPFKSASGIETEIWGWLSLRVWRRCGRGCRPKFSGGGLNYRGLAPVNGPFRK